MKNEKEVSMIRRRELCIGQDWKSQSKDNKDTLVLSLFCSQLLSFHTSEKPYIYCALVFAISQNLYFPELSHELKSLNLRKTVTHSHTYHRTSWASKLISFHRGKVIFILNPDIELCGIYYHPSFTNTIFQKHLPQ